MKKEIQRCFQCGKIIHSKPVSLFKSDTDGLIYRMLPINHTGVFSTYDWICASKLVAETKKQLSKKTVQLNIFNNK
jgi:hypothetical protein